MPTKACHLEKHMRRPLRPEHAVSEHTVFACAYRALLYGLVSLGRVYMLGTSGARDASTPSASRLSIRASATQWPFAHQVGCFRA